MFGLNPVRSFVSGATCSVFTRAFYLQSFLKYIRSMPFLCKCGAKFLFAIVFTVVMLLTSQYISLLKPL